MGHFPVLPGLPRADFMRAVLADVTVARAHGAGGDRSGENKLGGKGSLLC